MKTTILKYELVVDTNLYIGGSESLSKLDVFQDGEYI